MLLPTRHFSFQINQDHSVCVYQILRARLIVPAGCRLGTQARQVAARAFNALQWEGEPFRRLSEGESAAARSRSLSPRRIPAGSQSLVILALTPPQATSRPRAWLVARAYPQPGPLHIGVLMGAPPTLSSLKFCTDSSKPYLNLKN